MVKHVPADYSELPGNEKIKEATARIKAKKKSQCSKKSGVAAVEE